MKYSIIIPVYNRPDEVDELLESLSAQTRKDFEVVIVEDGSVKPCKDVCEKYAGILDLHYYAKENSGPGQSRNYGVERANGEYVIILDSDVVLPTAYMEAVDNALHPSPTAGAAGRQDIVAWGGPDAAHPSFTPIQKAISYSMTSFFTTGGIRGGKKKLDKFYPRSFNMGIRRDVYLRLGGFSKMRFGEDIDFSYRIVEAGYQPQLFPEAWVWHKRRTDLRKFYRQVYNSGIARINLEKRHPGTMKIVHLLPAAFTVGVIGLLACWLVGIGWLIGHLVSGSSQPLPPLAQALMICPLIPIILYGILIRIDATIQQRSMRVGKLAVFAAFTQLMGYGMGFLSAWWKRCVCGKDEFQAFEKNFYQ